MSVKPQTTDLMIWKLKVLITYPVYSHFLEYDLSRPNITGLLITYDVLIQRLSWYF